MSHDPTDLRAQQTRREETAEEERIRKLQEASDFRWLMRQPPFRRFLWRLLGFAGLYRSTFHEVQSVSAFREGRRDVGLFVQAEIQQHAPEQYELMLRERREKLK